MLGCEVGLGHQVRGRKGVCQGKEEERGWSHPTDSFQPKANCSGSNYCVLACSSEHHLKLAPEVYKVETCYLHWIDEETEAWRSRLPMLTPSTSRGFRMQSDRKGLPTAHSYLSFTLWTTSGVLMSSLATGFNLKACQESGTTRREP